MHSLHAVGLAAEGWPRGRLIGLAEVAEGIRLGMAIGAWPPGHGVLQVTPDPRHRGQCRAIGRQGHQAHGRRADARLGRRGPTGVQQEEMQAVGKGLGEGVYEQLKHVGIQRGELQEEALARGRGHGAVDREPFKGVLEHPDGLDPMGCESPSAHRQ
jgi:hypothetical protein